MYTKILLILIFSVVQHSLAIAPNTFFATVTGLNNPIDIATAPNGLYAYVTDGGSNSVRVIDTNPLSPTFNSLVAAPALEGILSNPGDIALTPNSQFAYVCNTGANSVVVINTNPQSSSFNTPVAAPGLTGVFDEPTSIAITPNGLYAYVVNVGNNNVNLIDIDPTSVNYNTVLSTPALNGVLINPFAIIITPDGNYAYVSNLNGTISVVDTNPASPTYNTLLAAPGLISVNAQPEGLAITANGLVTYVTNGASTAVTVLDSDPASPTFNTVVSAPNLLAAFNYPNGVVTTADGKYAYVSNYIGASGSISSVSVIDTDPSSATYNSTLSTPGLQLSFLTRFVALAITPDDRYVYVIDAYNNTANVIYTGIIEAPLNFTGCRLENIFLTQADLINRLTWSAPVIGNPPVAYNLYTNSGLTHLVAQIPASGTLQYLDHNQLPGINDTYYIVAVDAFGNSSEPAVVTVTQECAGN